MARRRVQVWLLIPVLGIGVLAAFVMGLWAFVAATTTPIYPSDEDVASLEVARATTAWDSPIAEARRLVRSGVREQNLPGISVAVGVGGSVVWAEGFGWADLEARVPASPSTRFRIGTMSTLLTSVGVGRLLDQGALSLDTPIHTYVPEYPIQPWPVTVRQLMAHTAGIRPDEGDEEPVTAPCDTTDEGLAHFADSPLLFEPGSRFRYSTYGWRLVSAAVETVSLQPFVRYMRNAVFEPLGLEDIQANAPGEPMRERAVHYHPRFAADTRYGPQAPTPLDTSCFSGSGAFLSTASDLARFVMAVQGGNVLTPGTLTALQTPVVLPTGDDTGYGLGWDLETVTIGGVERRVVFEDGMLRGGRVASLLAVREDGVVVVVLANIAFADTSTLALQVADIFTSAR